MKMNDARSETSYRVESAEKKKIQSWLSKHTQLTCRMYFVLSLLLAQVKHQVSSVR